MTHGERVKMEFIHRAMKRAEIGGYPIVEPTPDDNDRDLRWWLRALDAKAFLFSLHGSAAWLFPHYQLKLKPIEKRVVVRFEGQTIASSDACFEYRETAHSPQIYIPRKDVEMKYLFRTETLTFCPFKNLASYYGVRANGKEVVDAFWAYDDVYDKFPDNGNASDVLRLKGMLSPYRNKLDVEVLDG